MKLIKRILKKIVLAISRKNKHLKINIDCKKVWYGNKYGGFYAFPNSLDKSSIVYSFGIGEDISFDTALIENHGCKVYGFDPTPKSINWCRNQNLPANFFFFNFGIAEKSGDVDFYLPNKNEHVSGSATIHSNVSIEKKCKVMMKSLNEITKDLNHKKIDVLKLDIEGSEYDVIKTIPFDDIIINQILIEFHERFFKDGKQKTQKVIDYLNVMGYKIFAVSESYEEVSFIKINNLC